MGDYYHTHPQNRAPSRPCWRSEKLCPQYDPGQTGQRPAGDTDDVSSTSSSVSTHCCFCCTVRRRTCSETQAICCSQTAGILTKKQIHLRYLLGKPASHRASELPTALIPREQSLACHPHSPPSYGDVCLDRSTANMRNMNERGRDCEQRADSAVPHVLFCCRLRSRNFRPRGYAKMLSSEAGPISPTAADKAVTYRPIVPAGCSLEEKRGCVSAAVMRVTVS